jgi:hypothetical protein
MVTVMLQLFQLTNWHKNHTLSKFTDNVIKFKAWSLPCGQILSWFLRINILINKPLFQIIWLLSTSTTLISTWSWSSHIGILDNLYSTIYLLCKQCSSYWLTYRRFLWLCFILIKSMKLPLWGIPLWKTRLLLDIRRSDNGFY